MHEWPEGFQLVASPGTVEIRRGNPPTSEHALIASRRWRHQEAGDAADRCVTDTRKPAAPQRSPDGAACRNRTDDLRITSASLWPTELRRQGGRRPLTRWYTGARREKFGDVALLPRHCAPPPPAPRTVPARCRPSPSKHVQGSPRKPCAAARAGRCGDGRRLPSRCSPGCWPPNSPATTCWWGAACPGWVTSDLGGPGGRPVRDRPTGGCCRDRRAIPTAAPVRRRTSIAARSRIRSRILRNQRRDDGGNLRRSRRATGRSGRWRSRRRRQRPPATAGA